MKLGISFGCADDLSASFSVDKLNALCRPKDTMDHLISPLDIWRSAGDSKKRRKIDVSDYASVTSETRLRFICYRYGLWEVIRSGSSNDVGQKCFEVLGIRGVTETASGFLNDEAIQWSVHCSKPISDVFTLPDLEFELLSKMQELWRERFANILTSNEMTSQMNAMQRDICKSVHILRLLIEDDMMCDSSRFWPIAGDVHLEVKIDQLISSGRQLFATMNLLFPKPLELLPESKTALLSTNVASHTMTQAISLLNRCRSLIHHPPELVTMSQMNELQQLAFDLDAHLSPVFIESLLLYVFV